MRGFRTPSVPGWDCHALRTEHKVVKELREQKKTSMLYYAQSMHGVFSKMIKMQRSQFERLGILADWENDYRTMDPAYEECVLNFLRIVLPRH
jgi:isoleucyl-tRNA synthetase